MSPRIGYKQTAEHIRNRLSKKKQSTRQKLLDRYKPARRQARISPINAAQKLRRKFQDATWFTSVGVGTNGNDHACLYLYVSSLRRARSAFPQHQHAAAWYGLPVTLRRIARVRPARTAYQAAINIIDDPANEAAINDILAQHQKRFDEARAYLKRLDTTPDAQLTPEERFIKRMGQGG